AGVNHRVKSPVGRRLTSPVLRGEHAISRNPLRREGRVAPVEPVCSCAFPFFAHGTVGAASTRLSLRPPALLRGTRFRLRSRELRRDKRITRARSAAGMQRCVLNSVVIPGWREAAGPESMTTIREYGFRVRAKRRAPE